MAPCGWGRFHAVTKCRPLKSDLSPLPCRGHSQNTRQADITLETLAVHYLFPYLGNLLSGHGPLRPQEWMELEELSASISSPGLAPSAGQVVIVLLELSCVRQRHRADAVVCWSVER
jgi:hypothetical protein